MDCIFCKIIAKELPSADVYENELLVAFLDIHPVSVGHVLVVPKNHTNDFLSTDDMLLSNLLPSIKSIASAVMKGMGAHGCNISTNNGSAAGQVIFHLHWHIIPRFSSDGLKLWHSKEYREGEMEKVAKTIREHIR